MKNQVISKKDLTKLKTLSRPLVFAHMAVDLLHHGHIRILNKASKYGSEVVGLMTDKALEAYKGKPFLNYKERKEIISALKTVKYIIPIKSLDQVVEASELFKPEFFVHGTDWKRGKQGFLRKELIKKLKTWKGKVIELPYTKNISSSNIRNHFYKLFK